MQLFVMIMTMIGSPYSNYLHPLKKCRYIACVYSTQKVVAKPKKYSDTINLPRTKFPLRLSPCKLAGVEKYLVERCSDLYNYQRIYNEPSDFVLHDGPPYANGDLHMGHVVNKVLKDITLRNQVINHRRVHYKPGWDCHGLPIELKAMQRQGNVGPLEIRKKSRIFASKTIEKQQVEFKSWGVMADWEDCANKYRTFDAAYIIKQLQIFLELYDRGLIYRDVKPVYWSPSSRSALAEAELEYNPNYISPSVLVQLRLVQKPNELEKFNNVYAVIWTTTPWTLPANQAICYNLDLDYSLVKLRSRTNDNLYIIATDLLKEFEEKVNSESEIVCKIPGSHLCGASYIHPFYKDDIMPFLPAKHVQGTKGTGLVHTAPAHGPDDFLVGLQNGIKVKCLVNVDGKYSSEAPDFLVSKAVLEEGNKLVLDFLGENVLYSGTITHAYPIDWRTKKPVILRASEQWFINTDKLKKQATTALESVTIHPRAHSDISRKTLITQLEKRPYWCISRQRVWGVPIPVIYEKLTKKHIINKKLVDRLCSLVQKYNDIDFWWAKNLEEIIGDDLLKEWMLTGKQIEKGQDILDIWFDSGISWSYALDGEKVADVYLEGVDQFTGWFQSSLLTSVACRDDAPYKKIFVHGFAVDENGLKMSKSLGNIILPRDIVGKYGTDVMRWWVASHATQNTSITVSHHLMQSCADYLSKIRSIFKYLLGVIGERQESENNNDARNIQLKYLDKYMLNELYKFERETNRLYNSFEYNRVTALVQNFLNNEVSGFYLHLVKDRLYCDSDEEYLVVKYVLTHSFQILCKVLWPIIPFLIEECWSYHGRDPLYKTRINSSENWISLESENVICKANNLRHMFHQQIKDLNTWTLNITITANEENFHAIKALHPSHGVRSHSTELCELLQVSSILLDKGKDLSSENPWEISINSIESNLCPRCRRFSIENNDELCSRCTNILKHKEIR